MELSSGVWMREHEVLVSGTAQQGQQARLPFSAFTQFWQLLEYCSSAGVSVLFRTLTRTLISDPEKRALQVRCREEKRD